MLIEAIVNNFHLNFDGSISAREIIYSFFFHRFDENEMKVNL